MQITTADLGLQLRLDYDVPTVPGCLVAEQLVGAANAAAIVQVQLVRILAALTQSVLMLTGLFVAPV